MEENIFLILGLLVLGLLIYLKINFNKNLKSKKVEEISTEEKIKEEATHFDIQSATVDTAITEQLKNKVTTQHKSEIGNTGLKLSDGDSILKPEATTTLDAALTKTRDSVFGRIRNLFSGDTKNKHFDEIEEVLYTSDLGSQTVERLMESLKDKLSKSEKADSELVKQAFKDEMEQIFSSVFGENLVAKDEPLSNLSFAPQAASKSPTVWMIVGVNGAGKTTSIGKISAQLAQSGRRVLVAAGDTFRAAAESQLKVWTERAQVDIFSPEGVSDPSAVAFDAVNKAKKQGYDVVIVDTAGRLHTQSNLMEELKKMKRVMQKIDANYPHEILIVLDANSGQNALMQAREFNAALGLTGVVLTKMDGTAKGGVAIGITNELKLKIKLIGVGEKIGDLRSFSPREFVESIL